jgi:transmembrane sensor
MSEQDIPRSDEARREAAATWLVRLEAPDASEADWRAFESWLGDPANKQALDAIEAAMAVVEDHKDAFQASAPRAKIIAFPTRKAVRGAVFLGLAAAAAAAVLLLVAPRNAASPVQEMAYAAPADAVRAVALPDASSITLNRGAALRVRWSAHERRIELLRGEAAFAVTHDAARPFVVAAGAYAVRDLGTEFDVFRAPDGLTVTVRTGSVAILTQGGSATLAPGEQMQVSEGRMTRRSINADDAFAWKGGRLVYRDAPLSAVVADLNRYSATPIAIADANAAQLRFSGVLIIDDPSSMTRRLEAFLPIRSEQTAQGIILRSR